MMRKFFLTLVALFVVAELSAQRYDEVVYLRNGSEIRGSVIEYTSGKTIKIQTRDGSIFVFQSNEVERISKVQYPKERTAGIEQGHRWFVEIAETIGECYRAEVSGIYGYQIYPKLFVGGGLGLHIYPDEAAYEVPIFADIRYDFINRRATPFVDVRGGYTVGTYFGPYCSPTVGARIRLGIWGAINIGAGYTMQFLEDYNEGGLTIRVGFEF